MYKLRKPFSQANVRSTTAAGWIPPAFTDFFPPTADMLLKSVNIDFLADSRIIIPPCPERSVELQPPRNLPPIYREFFSVAPIRRLSLLEAYLTVHMEMDLAAT